MKNTATGRQQAAGQAQVASACPSWWDEQPRPGRSFLQSSYWGKYLEGRREFRPFYCYLEADGRVKGVLLAYLAAVESPLAKLFGLKKLYWHQGPLLADSGDMATARALLEALFHAAGGWCVVHGTPPYIDQKEVGDLYPALAGQYRLKTGKWATYLVDLTGGEEKAWSNLVPDARRLVKNMGESGYEVRRLGKEDMGTYLDLLRLYRKSAGLALPPFYPTVELLELMGEDAVLLPGAYLDDKLCAVSPAMCYGTTCTFYGAAQEPDLRGRDKSVSYLLHWEIIKSACSAELKTYDLSGVAPEPDSVKEVGIKRFKGKWGGEYLEYPVIEGGYRTFGRMIFSLLKLLKPEAGIRQK